MRFEHVTVEAIRPTRRRIKSIKRVGETPIAGMRVIRFKTTELPAADTNPSVATRSGGRKSVAAISGEPKLHDTKCNIFHLLILTFPLVVPRHADQC